MNPTARRDGLLSLVAILLLAFNLRVTAISVNPVLKTLIADLQLSAVSAGTLTSLPVLCFGVFGAMAPRIAARAGLHRTVVAALVLMIAGQVARTFAGGAVAFLSCSALALGGMAVANVLLPSLVKTHFPHRIGLVTSLYSTLLAVGVTVAGMATVPLTHLLGGWRRAFLFGAAAAVVAVPAWLAMVRLDRAASPSSAAVDAPAPAPIAFTQVARSRLGWAMALFFGFQSMLAYSVFGWLPSIYQAAGYSETQAGLLLGVMTGAGIPMAFLIPAYTARVHSPHRLLLTLSACAITGLLSLMIAPTVLPWLAAIVLSAGLSAFPMILALLGTRARTAAGVAALSGFAQSVGYLLAGLGPLLVSLVHESTQGWTWPIAAMLAMVVPLTGFGLAVCRPQHLEDEVAPT